MAQSNQRFALDLDDIERQLKQAQLQSPPSKSDPLAELARIVGQNDPFKTLLVADKRGGSADQALLADPDGSPSHGYAADPVSISPADRAVPGTPPTQAYAQPSYEESAEEFYPLEPRRSRRGLITVAVVLGTAIAAVSGALMLRNRPVATATGEPPVIQAESDPLKIKPENPGGVEIPNQNAQVYERSGADKQTRVVNREEQPVDVQQAARAAPAAPGIAAATAPNNAVASLGEPRRVRTVSVRPDGTIVSPDQPGVGVPPTSAQPAPSRPAEPTLPSSSGATPAPTAPQAAAPARPRPEARSTTPTVTATPSQPPPAARSALTAPPPSSPLSISANGAQQPEAPQRNATAAPPRAADASETTSAAGGFSVQLSVTTAEDTARAQAQALQRKYAGELGGRTPLVRTAEVNGKTLHRVRVGPMSKDDANDLCAKVKEAGGDKACFVARN
jgi:hypothetical protein